MLKQTVKLATIIGLYCSTYITQAAELYEVRDHPVNATITIGGTIVPFKEVTLSAQLPGRITKIAGEEGDEFKEGTVLVAIDDKELRAKRRETIAALMGAEASLYNAETQFSREIFSPQSKKSPGGMGLPSLFDQYFTKPAGDFLGQTDPEADRHADLYNRGTAIEQARGALMRIESQIDQIDSKLRDARGLAPFDGVITMKLVEIGDTVQPGQQLIKFADIQSLQIEVDVPARLVAGLQEGMENISARLDATSITGPIPVRVAQIYPVADRKRHTIKVKFDLPLTVPVPINGGQFTEASVQQIAFPGEYAEVDIPNPDASGRAMVIVPASALVQSRGSLPGIYVLNKETNEFQWHLVRKGKTVSTPQCPQCINVLSGLKIGDTIDINPQN